MTAMIEKVLKDHIIESLNKLVDEGVIPAGLDYSKITVSRTKDGYSTNSAMVVAAQLQKDTP